MNIEFLYNIIIFSSIYFIISSGFNLFFKIRSTIDFSYIAIVVFSSYSSVLLSNNYNMGLLSSTFSSFLLTIPFTIFILYLSKKLQDIYFAIGTLSIYILSVELARNIDITGGALGISLNSSKLFFDFYLTDISDFLVFSTFVSILLVFFLTYLKKTYLFKILEGWGENEVSTSSLGIKSDYYKVVLILITAFLASLGGTINVYYLSYIDPSSFWLYFIIPLLMISILSYKLSSIFTYIISLFIIGFYELLRLVPIGDYTQVGYYREMIFTFLVMVIAYIVFRRDKVFREV